MAIEDPASLELTAEQMQRMGEETLAHVVAHVASLHSQPSRGNVDAADLCQSLREPAPEHGSDLGSLLGPLFNDWIPRSFTTPGPGYLAYIPGGGLYPAALADFISAATNRYTGVWLAAPALGFTFHLSWPGASLEQENAATRALPERVTVRGRVMITGCSVDGRYLARVCVLSFRSRQAQIDACVEDIAAEAAGLCG